MAPAGKGKGPAERVEARNVLQAVLLADSFTQRFRPITVERPKVLLPLVNVPMIEYTLEWLATNKVQEVFIFCCAHADQVKQYIADSKWSKCRDMVVSTVVSTSCLSVGEALRLMDEKGIIQNDFVLVSGDTVSNVNLGPIVKAHKARRVVDKQAIFTMVMKPTHHKHQRLRLGDIETTVVLDPASSRLLKHHEPDCSSKAPFTMKVDPAFFSERDAVQVRTDLMDTHIYICAPEVLMLFTDNFDFANLKRDFIPGVLSEEELGSKLYVHETGQGEYSAHIHNLRSYDAVSRDIMQRWAFPLVPDTNILWRGGAWGQTSFRYARGHRYYEQSVSIHRTANMGEDVCVGAGTSIADESRVVQSVVGRDVRIGKNVDILGSYIMDGVTIEDGVVMRSALVCEGAMIKAGAVLEAGAVVSYNVVVAANHTVPPNTRISLCRQLQQVASLSDDELEYVTAPQGGAAGGAPPSAVGAGAGAGAGRAWESDDDSGYSDDPLGQSLERPSHATMKVAEALAIGQSVPAEEASSLAHFDTDVVGPGGAGYRWNPTETLDMDRQLITPPNIVEVFAVEGEREAEEEAAVVNANKVTAEDEVDTDDEDADDSAEYKFKLEVSETLLRCVKLKYDQSNANIELQGLKIAEDRSFADLAKYMFTTLLAMCLPAPDWVTHEYIGLFPPRGSPRPAKLAMLTAFRKLLREYRGMLQKFLRTEEDQEELLLTFEDYCSEDDVFANKGEHGSAYAEVFGKILELCYDEEILTEGGIEAWAAAKAEDAEEDQEYLKRAAGFLEWLRTASEDAEDDEDEDDE